MLKRITTPSNLIEHLIEVTKRDNFWCNYLKEINNTQPLPFSFHLAIMVEPFLTFVMNGRKTVESRFSINKCAPYNYVDKGDVVILKESGGPVAGICKINYASFHILQNGELEFIRKNFSEVICATGAEFWEERKSKSYATLMMIDEVLPLEPFNYIKKDRRGWAELISKGERLILPEQLFLEMSV